VEQFLTLPLEQLFAFALEQQCRTQQQFLAEQQFVFLSLSVAE
jgi:hypothetical protein